MTSYPHIHENFTLFCNVFVAQVLLNLTRPYRKVTIPFIARELALEPAEVESLLVDMILDQKLDAYIDQIKGHVVLQPSGNGGAGAGAGAAGTAGSGSGAAGVESAAATEAALFANLSLWADRLALVNEGFGSKIA